MKLYHGTSEARLDSILSRGLRPRGKRSKGNWDSYPSRHDCVYLTDAYAPYFAWSATKKGGRSAIIEVDVPESRLLPDEDFIAQALASQTGLDIDHFHASVRDDLDGYKHHAMDSLRGLGNACHKGVIRPAAITRYVVVDFDKQRDLHQSCLDPSISILNYRFCGEKYKSIIAWLFGDRDDYIVGFGESSLDVMESIHPGYKARVEGLFTNREGIEVHSHGCVCQ